MNPENWKKIKEVFAEAVELPMAERDDFLNKNCNSEIRAEVEKMLAMDADNSLENSPLQQFNLVGKNIGKYKIISEIGRGGMGNVYLATREDLGQKVAIKIIKRGLDSADILRRFKHESEILATLEHPNIARLIDSGTTPDGLPFYAMEFVEGQPIDEFCSDKSLEEKLDLFRQVCKAVAYAHARLVVHRDLKPSNIIVDADGNAKLLDFGVAKILSEDNFGKKGTATSLGMMTPNYASPEQIRGEQVTTATDIYSLGIILYELLTGVLPYDLQDKTLDKVLEIVSKTEITRPSDAEKTGLRGNISSSHTHKVSLSEIRGDLDNIVLKSLQKEPERRYQSVKDFSEDIRRYLVGLPISARPDTFRYRAAKFIQRNTIAVGAASLVFLSLIGGIIGIYYQYRNANRQRALAEKRFADVRELANKVVFRYHDEIAKFPGAVALREELVQDAVKYLDNLAADEIDDNSLKLELARAYQKIGDVQGRPYTANLGKSEEAVSSYQKSIDILENAVAKSPKEIELQRELVKTYLRIISLKKRLVAGDAQHVDRVLSLQLQINETDDSKPLENALQLADVYITQADYHYGNELDKRIETYKKAANLLENIPNKTLEIQHMFTKANQRIGTNYVWRGDELSKNGDTAGSLENYRLGLPYNEKFFESTKLEIAIGGVTQNLQRILAGCYQNLGENYLKLGEKEKGLELLRKNLEITLELAKADEKNTEAKLDVANSYLSFANAYEQFGEIEKAVTADEKAVEILQKLIPADTRNLEVSNALVVGLNKAAKLLEKANQKGEAKIYREKLAEFCNSGITTSECSTIGLR